MIFGLSFLLSDAGDIMGFSSVSAQSFLKISIFAFTKTVLEQRYLRPKKIGYSRWSVIHWSLKEAKKNFYHQFCLHFAFLSDMKCSPQFSFASFWCAGYESCFSFIFTL